MDSWRLGEDWERAGHSYTLTLLTCITLHPLEAPAAGSTTEQEQDELQASPQAAALFTPAVPQLRGHPFPGMDTGKGQLNLLPQCCQLQNVSSRAPKLDLFRIHKFLQLRIKIRTFPADTNCDRKQQQILTTAKNGHGTGKLSTRGRLSPEGRGLFSLHSISSSTLCWKLAKFCNAQSIAAKTLFPRRGSIGKIQHPKATEEVTGRPWLMLSVLLPSAQCVVLGACSERHLCCRDVRHQPFQCLVEIVHFWPGSLWDFPLLRQYQCALSQGGEACASGA